MDGHYQFNKRFNPTYDIFCYVFYHSYYIGFYYIIYGYMGLFDIYNKEHRRTIMAKETIKEMLKMIDAKINHIEDMTADHRAIIVKLVTQSNSIVKFLSQLEINDITDEYDDISSLPSFDDKLVKNEDKTKELKELIEEFKERSESLRELEEELKKHKGDITPGQVGEA